MVAQREWFKVQTSERRTQWDAKCNRYFVFDHFLG